jgi:hypothetical protein
MLMVAAWIPCHLQQGLVATTARGWKVAFPAGGMSSRGVTLPPHHQGRGFPDAVQLEQQAMQVDQGSILQQGVEVALARAFFPHHPQRYLDPPEQRAELAHGCTRLPHCELFIRVASPISPDMLLEYSRYNPAVFNLGSSFGELRVPELIKQLLCHHKVLQSVSSLQQLLVDIIFERDAPHQSGAPWPRMHISDVLQVLQQRKSHLTTYLAVSSWWRLVVGWCTMRAGCWLDMSLSCQTGGFSISAVNAK